MIGALGCFFLSAVQAMYSQQCISLDAGPSHSEEDMQLYSPYLSGDIQMPPELMLMILKKLDADDLVHTVTAYANTANAALIYELARPLIKQKLLKVDSWKAVMRTPLRYLEYFDLFRNKFPLYEHIYERPEGYPDGFYKSQMSSSDDSSTDDSPKFRKKKVHSPRFHSPLEKFVFELDKEVLSAFLILFPNAQHLIAKQADRPINTKTLAYEIQSHIWYDYDDEAVPRTERLHPIDAAKQRPLRVRFARRVRLQHRGDVHAALNWEAVRELWYRDGIPKDDIEPAKLMTINPLEGNARRGRVVYLYLIDRFKETGLPDEWFFGEEEKWYWQHAYINQVRWGLGDYGRMMS